MAPKIVHEAGEKIGRFTIINEAGRNKKNNALWLCRCECGNEVIVVGSSLRRGLVKSCGCYNRDLVTARNTKHGLSKSRTYSIWANMIRRTTKRSSSDWYLYGGRGIKPTESWMSFEGFFNDMGEAPEGMSLDRIDNDLGYFKENCRWVDAKVQARNTRRCVPIYVDNTKFPTASSAAEFLGVDPQLVSYRTKKGFLIVDGYKVSRVRPTAPRKAGEGETVTVTVNGIMYDIVLTPKKEVGSGLHTVEVMASKAHIAEAA